MSDLIRIQISTLARTPTFVGDQKTDFDADGVAEVTEEQLAHLQGYFPSLIVLDGGEPPGEAKGAETPPAKPQEPEATAETGELDLSEMTLDQLRAIAADIDVDVSACTTREEMIALINDEVNPVDLSQTGNADAESEPATEQGNDPPKTEEPAKADAQSEGKPKAKAGKGK